MEQPRFVKGDELASTGTQQLATPASEHTVILGRLNHGASPDIASPAEEQDCCPAAADERTPIQSAERKERNEQTLANVYTDPRRHTVSLLLDDSTANCVIYAVRALAADYEAHAREVRLVSDTLPPDSYGAVTRLRIAGRHERIAARLRVLERNYQSEVSGGWTPQSASDAI